MCDQVSLSINLIHQTIPLTSSLIIQAESKLKKKKKRSRIGLVKETMELAL